MRKLIEQIMKFGVVGFLCFFIDYGLMILFTEAFHINYLVSAALSFSISTIVNYSLSMRYVFKSKKDANKINEFILFVVLSVIGLGVNEAAMWIAVEGLGIHYMISKIGATAVVMVFNFVTRKIFLEDKSE
ncbi:MAG TPA: GtrA family protein [Candidatus Mediterraneibacter faecipullorum]|uniref:GtrA family protein n=1 Tax=Candidatus Mediterraneibacter faecipullorum TaxID=2838670 RepID=A0A9D2NJQ5_9FIRM|nr:GtrA family protein [Candidatus Mediterraneibacter faecipullorum]